MIKILFLGDIVGKIGRNAVKDVLPSFMDKYSPDFVIANGENATHGKGLSVSNYAELSSYGINAITMGNHFFQVSEIMTKNDEYPNLVRPYNLDESVPGVGTRLFQLGDVKIRVSNLLGRVFVEGSQSNPFDDLASIIAHQPSSNIHIVDFHAEATGEKMSLGLAFDGKVSAVIGTHTHVQTNDARILPKGTGFISDVGMCGFYDGILGVEKENVIQRTWKGLPGRFEVPDNGRAIVSGVLLTINERLGTCESIQPLNEFKEY